MYKAYSALDYKKFLGLPDDYKVDGLLSYGAWDREKHNNRIKHTLQTLGVKFEIIEHKGFLSYVLEIVVDKKRYWFIVAYGGALLSELTHLACLFGSKKNIHIGSCGGLNPEAEAMDLVLPTYSYGNESTTRAYEPDATDYKHFADKALTLSLRNKLSTTHKIWSGPIITYQAMMGETWDDIKKWSGEGYLGVEMETATIFAVSKHFHVPSASLIYVSDNLIKGQTVGDETHAEQKTEREKVKDSVYVVGTKTLLE